jgi:hypothetical protein
MTPNLNHSHCGPVIKAIIFFNFEILSQIIKKIIKSFSSRVAKFEIRYSILQYVIQCCESESEVNENIKMMKVVTRRN